MMEYDYATLRDGLKRYGTQTRLKEISKKLKEAVPPDDVKLLDCLSKDDLSALSKTSQPSRRLCSHRMDSRL